MTPSTWKGKEAALAALLCRAPGCDHKHEDADALGPEHTRRVALSGGNNTQARTRSDTTDPAIYAEGKYGKVGKHIPAWVVNLWRETVPLAAAEGKVPLLAIMPKRGRHWPNGSGLGLGVTTIERLTALEAVAAAARTQLDQLDVSEGVLSTDAAALRAAIARLEESPGIDGHATLAPTLEGRRPSSP